MSLVSWIDRKFYPRFERNWDDALFREKILPLLGPGTRVLNMTGKSCGILATSHPADRNAHKPSAGR